MNSQTQKPATTHVRISRELAVKLAAISRATYTTTAELLDPILREWVEREFSVLPKDMQRRALARIEAASK